MAALAHQIINFGMKHALDAAGGPARLQVIAVLAGVLALDTADKGAVSAVAGPLKQAFGINNTDIGLLLAAVSFIGALGTWPAGILADRISRKKILLAAIVIWTITMIITGMADSYLRLLLTRLALGAVTAAAWPCVASLAGDFFPASERAGIFGLVLAGELTGVGIGFFLSGEVSALINWRWAFYVMALPSLIVLWAVWRHLPEPDRGKQSWIVPGEADAFAAAHGERSASAGGAQPQSESARDLIRKKRVEPRKALVLDQDPAQRGWWWVFRYLLRLPTYVLLIVASSLTYYFFAGFRAFGISM